VTIGTTTLDIGGARISRDLASMIAPDAKQILLNHIAMREAAAKRTA
jgi:hypothetical protein